MSSLNKATILLGVVLLLPGCGKPVSPPANQAVSRPGDMAQITRGKLLFSDNCARCHGATAEGDPQWRYRHPDGTFPPPPLNGSGHAWHHSHEWLHEVIRSGTEPDGHMPAWGRRLSDAQIDDIIAWFQSLWPEEVYQTWAEMEQHGRTAPR